MELGLDINFEKVKTTSLAYFRKVNFLVAFFEEYGMDIERQTSIRISRDMLEELIKRCSEVLTDHSVAETILPTCDGFFFGPTAYDDWYFECVKEVLNVCQDILLPEFDNLEEDEELIFSIWY